MESLMIGLICGMGGLLVGAVVAYLWAERKGRAKSAELETARAVGEQKIAGMSEEATRAAAEARAKEAELEAEVAKERAGAEKIRAELAACAVELTQAKTELQASRSNIAEQKKLLDDANAKMTQAFAAVSQETLAKNNEAFLAMAKAKFETLTTDAAGSLETKKAQFATLLTPLSEMLTAYQKRLDVVEASRTNAYGELLKQIGGMSATQQVLATQTTQLVSALKKSNVRGRWGEIALQRIGEMAGMTEHVDFSQQESTVSEEGRMLRPDMVVKLPGNRCVVVDSKAVMNAFIDAMGVSDEAARGVLMMTHAKNVRSRIDDLSGKAYWSQFANAPEFVVLFLPGEAFLYGACESDPELIQYAISQRVLLATPTTLIGLLQTIERGWRQEAISENAEDIRKLGTEIYDRLATLAENMTKLGKSLDGAVENYNKTIGTLETRVLVSARKISELGAKTDREMPELSSVDKRARELAAELHPEKSPLLGE